MSDELNQATGNAVKATYSGARNELFMIGLKTAFLTLITVGIYRFWAKTRIRSYVWGATHIEADSFEYTGTGIEKFKGFLVAVVFLAIYLGIFQMALLFFGLNLFVTPETPQQSLTQSAAINLGFLALLPFIFFAQYRARRYKLSRSRLRGIRFGMDAAAWGYVLRAIGHLSLTVLTVGLLLPRQTFYLEKYMTDRSWYGDTRFTQTGKWTQLFPAMKHIAVGVLIAVAGLSLFMAMGSPILAAICAAVGLLWINLGVIYYRVASFRILTAHKQLGPDITFQSNAKTGSVVLPILIGGFVISLVFGALISLGAGIVNMATFGDPMTGNFVFVTIVTLVLYAVALVVISPLVLVIITQPILSHIVNTTWIFNPGALDIIGQRAADQGADAEGFADALDVGGAL